MRRASFFVLALFLMAPAYAYADFTSLAQTAGIKDNGVCKGVNAGDPSGSQTFSESSISLLRSYIQKAVLCASACFDERIGVSVPSISPIQIKINVSASNQCKKSTQDPTGTDSKANNRGCDKNQTQPKVTISIPEVGFGLVTIMKAQVIGPKSRCDSNVTGLFDSMFDNVSSSNYSGALDNLNALSQLPPTVTPFQGNVNGNDNLLSAFAAAGVSKEDAQTAIDKDPQAAQDYLNAYAAGDQAKLTEAAKKLDLNDDLSNVKSLAVQQALSNSDASSPAGGTNPSADNSGFNADKTTALQGQCGIQGFAGNIMYAESRCGQSTYSAVSSVQGAYQYLCGTWQKDTAAVGMTQYSDCAYRNNTDIATQVVNARYDLYQQQYGGQCAAAGLTWTSCAYAIHVFGENGYQRILAAEQSNPNASSYDLCGSAVSSSACSNNLSIFRNGGTVAGVFNELDRRLGGTGTVITNVASPSSPFNVSAGTGTYYANIGSPFGSVNPLYYGNTGLTSYATSPIFPPTTVSPAPATIGTPAPTPVSQQIIQSGTTGATPSGSTAPAVATLIAQPNPVLKGSSITISWSSVGMRSDQPCQLFAGSTFIAQGNEGTRTFDTASVPTSTTVGFVLQCFSPSGTVKKTASSTVQ